MKPDSKTAEKIQRTMKFSNIAWGILLAGTLSAACIREDLSECVYDDAYSRNTLLLSYKGDGTTEIFNDKICRTELYVFDRNNQCVYSGELSAAQIAARSAELPPLAPGDYRIVCLGNTHHTEVRGLETCDFDQIVFASEDYFGGQRVSGNDSLYHASLLFPVTGEDRTETAEFASSHYDLSVEVAGIANAEVRASGPLTIEACGVSTCTDFENRICDETADYVLETEYEAGVMTARTNLMRHENHEAVDICVRSAAGELLAQVNLADFLAANPIIDCSRQEVMIPIRIEFSSVGVKISVPQWYIQQIKPEF